MSKRSQPNPTPAAGAAPPVEAGPQDAPRERARAFAEPMIAVETLDTGENMLAHADGVADILRDVGATESVQAACYLVYACDYLTRPKETIAKAFGESHALLAVETSQLVRLQHQTRIERQRGTPSTQSVDAAAAQTENVRKMLLAFSRDLRVVMLRLASRLQTLRHYAASKLPVPEELARESLHVFAHLANRLGVWQLKWELEDLAFRFLEPSTYREIARQLDEKRFEREAYVERLRQEVQRGLAQQGLRASVQGRPKHIYSIVKKMRGKSLAFDEVLDLRALRVVVPEVSDCYAALSWVHARFNPMTEHFDDYIAKPKVNGYRSLHTIVCDRSPAGAALPVEIQIRTQQMHEHAEHGVAAHWAYKEAGSRGYEGIAASGDYESRIAVLRQLLAWQRDVVGQAQEPGLFEDRIYVLTPEAAIIELPARATPVDFAYSVHTSLGHRCRGARVDGVMVPLNTALQNGQTVQIVTSKEGGPSRDWLNAELGYLASHRARSKVRAWFNALATHETVARGREAVEKLLQREGKTAVSLDDLAARLGFKAPEALFEVVGKDEFSLRNIETLLRPAGAGAVPTQTSRRAQALDGQRVRGTSGKPGGVLVVGVDSLLTQLAGCCRPAPPDAIQGFVTRGKGVSVHRDGCSALRQLMATHPQRVIEVEWGARSGAAQGGALYPVDVVVGFDYREHLLRDLLDVFGKEKLKVVATLAHAARGAGPMVLTVEVPDTSALSKALKAAALVPGVRFARRR
jgi:GTP pyrophosphokinase